MRWRGAVLGAAALGALLLTVCLYLTWRAWSAGVPVSPYSVTNPVVAVGFLVPAVVIGWHRPRNTLTWLLALGAIGHLVAGIGVAGHAWGLQAGWPAWVVHACLVAMGTAWLVGLGPVFSLLLLVFPDGRLPSSRWRWLVCGVLAVLAAHVLAFGVAPDSMVVNVVVQLADLATTAAAIVALVLRYRRGDNAVQGQILWLLLAVLIMLVLNAQRAVTGRGPELLLLSFVLVPVAMAIAIVRHRMLDIRLVVSRTLLYGLLVGLVLAGYAALVALSSAVLPPDLAQWGPVTSALVVALALNPVRLALDGAIGRAFYGRRADPAALLTTDLSDADDLGTVLDQAQTALRLPGLAIVAPDGTVVAGRVAQGRNATIPLSDGDDLGSLVVSLRVGENRLHRQDAAAMQMLAAPLALLLRERALADALRVSRAQVVRARESERSLLHRDLHDGLGPTLTSASLRADAAANVIHAEPDAAAELLTDVREGLREALDDVRRVVYGLRPLALEELGLVGAIREHARRSTRLPVSVTAEDRLTLPPAVELAAFRIVVEAITNALRHSRGSQVGVVLAVGGNRLTIRVEDDGGCTGSWTPGVGLRSVAERAEELGGGSRVTATEDAWLISAWMPVTTTDPAT